MNNRIIAAIATAHGTGAIGIIRMSGGGCLEILKNVFHPCESRCLFEPRRMYYGSLNDPSDNSLVDMCMAVFFRAPASYTGEDCVEIYCHGGISVLKRALRSLFNAGAVHAQPGEFTKRAFLNGKLDLFEAEAVIDLISAQTDIAAKNAAKQLRGVGADSIYSARKCLIQIMSSFYADVDFPDEGVPSIVHEDTIQELFRAKELLLKLYNTYERGSVIKDGIPVAIIGRPNVGKSSLLNALCGKERAIVTENEGTTRDIIDERFVYKDTVFRLCDTAGIREASDTAERLGIQRALDAANDAAVLIIVVDGSRPLTEKDNELIKMSNGKNAVIVSNKSDISIEYAPRDSVAVSSKFHDGIDALCEKLYRICGHEYNHSEVLLTNARQASALNAAICSIEHAIEAVSEGITLDAALTEVEAAANSLGEITGETASEDIVADIFSRFCVGK